MKKISLIISIAMLLSTAGSAQTMQASIGIGSNASSVRIYLKCSGALAAGNISTLQYTIGIPAATTPVPTLSITSTSILSGFQISPAYTEGGYIVYEIQTAISGPVTMSANTETQAMELQFTNGPAAAPAPVSLITLPFAGSTTGSALFYCTGAATSIEGSLYYARAGTVVTNNTSYSGGPTSFAMLAGVLLPVKITDFTAVRKNKDALLNWTIENQDAVTDHFEVERSTNGIDFTKIAAVAASATSTGTASYTITDPNIDAIRASVVYYRIKTVDSNGGFVYSDIKAIKLTAATITMSLFPNPANTFTNLMYTIPAASSAIIRITDESGKEMYKTVVEGISGVNRQHLDLSKFAAGKYILTMSTGGESQSIPFVKE